MATTLTSLFFLSASVLVYVWCIYPLVLLLLSKGCKKEELYSEASQTQGVSILIACLNEQSAIASRISNIFESKYPINLIEVIVISDGSTDDTVKIAQAAADTGLNIKIVETGQKSGRASAHNAGVLEASEEILVFTDAGTTFHENFIAEITQPFLRENIGFSTGTLGYTNSSSTAITESVGIYWKFEQGLRMLESKIGLNVFGSGACCAMRKSLYRDIPPTGDVDFTSPLDAALQGFQCVHIPTALAYDEMPASQKSELSARIRMTSKNFKGTLERWGWEGVFSYPALTWVILSHKYGRWITPFLLCAILLSSMASLFLVGGIFFGFAVFLQFLFYTLGILGFFQIPVPLASTVYSFLLGNYGMMLGVLKAIRGKVQSSYTPIRNDAG